MTQRFVIKDDLTLSMIEERAYALDWGWMGTKRPPETPNLIHSWQTLDGATVVHVEDAAVGVRYFVVNGPNAEKAEADLRRTMRLFSLTELIDAAERASG